MNHAFYLKKKKRFLEEFHLFILMSKDYFVFIYFGFIYYLLHLYGQEGWMALGATSFLYQVGFINLFIVIFQYFHK